MKEVINGRAFQDAIRALQLDVMIETQATAMRETLESVLDMSLAVAVIASGKSGVGKSALINAILGWPLLVEGGGMDSVTKIPKQIWFGCFFVAAYKARRFENVSRRVAELGSRHRCPPPPPKKTRNARLKKKKQLLITSQGRTGSGSAIKKTSAGSLSTS